LLGPPGVMLLGALICAVGGFWAAVKQSELREAAKAQTELLRDIAARSGDKKELEELIKARSRVLNADRGKADSVADGILKRLPDLTNEFNAMQENKRSDFENRTADFRLKWEPLVNNTLSFFDDLVDECTKRGINLERSPNEALKLTSTLDTGTATTLRGVICNGVVALIIYNPARFNDKPAPYIARMSFNIQDKG